MITCRSPDPTTPSSLSPSTGRADLRAQAAGLLEGFSEGQPDEPLMRHAAQLCRDPGAEPELTPG